LLHSWSDFVIAVNCCTGVWQEKVMAATDSVAAEHFALQTKFAHWAVQTFDI
jgi:hypothetical protein